MKPLDVMKIGTWAAEECDRQRSGELSVGWMLKGWLYAYQHRLLLPTEADIKHLGGLVEPRHNDGFSWRKGNVQIRGKLLTPALMVPDGMTRLMAHLADIDRVADADEWYRLFEEIHPFRDGNGRTGSILWNWLRRSLDAPEAPPDFWERG